MQLLTGSGTGESVGNFNLTGTYQKCFQKDGSGVYAENDWNLYAKENSTSVIEFRIQFRDDDQGDDTNNDGAFNPIDEDVSGVLDSVVGERLPTGSRVALTSQLRNPNNPDPNHIVNITMDEKLSKLRFW